MKILIAAGLLAAAVAVALLSGFGLPAILLFAAFFAVAWWGFLRSPRPDGELPSSSVSCCHYLGDQDDGQASKKNGERG